MELLFAFLGLLALIYGGLWFYGHKRGLSVKQVIQSFLAKK